MTYFVLGQSIDWKTGTVYYYVSYSSTTIITGHTSGIGKYLYENINCNVIEIVRPMQTNC